MSADNFFFITRHPLGGFAVLMGFSSSDAPLVATKKSMKFETFPEAMTYANGEYSEYGVQVSQDVLDDMASEGKVAKAPVTLNVDLIGNCQHLGDVWYDRDDCSLGDSRQHTRCVDCNFALDGCLPQVNIMLDKNTQRARGEVIEKIRENHEVNHVSNGILKRVLHDGSPMPESCACEENIELIVFLMLDTALERNNNEDLNA